MKEQLETIQKNALEEISHVEDMKELQAIKVAYLGKKGSLTQVLRGMGKLTKEERPVIGELANQVRETITKSLEEKTINLEKQEMEKQLAKEAIDITLPGRPAKVGGQHLLTQIIAEIEDLF